MFPYLAALGESWRSMTPEDALAYLLAEDAARRTSEASDQAYGLHLTGIANRKRLVAWRRENKLCPKCGRAIPADKVEFKHCPSCRKAFREYQRHANATLNEPQRLARNERARRSYHRLVHGKPAPPKVVAQPAPPSEVVARNGPKRDRASYFRAYRLARKAKS